MYVCFCVYMWVWVCVGVLSVRACVEPLSPSPSPLLDFKQDLDGRDDVALHPAVQIMHTKLDLGEITSEEFQIMLYCPLSVGLCG